jgi:hypothetical protein
MQLHIGLLLQIAEDAEKITSLRIAVTERADQAFGRVPVASPSLSAGARRHVLPRAIRPNSVGRCGMPAKFNFDMRLLLCCRRESHRVA